MEISVFYRETLQNSRQRLFVNRNSQLFEFNLMSFTSMELIVFAIAHALALVAAGHALLTKRDPRAALGWTVTLVFLPIIGLAIYLIFGISRAQSRAEKMIRKQTRIASRYSISKRPLPRPSMQSQEEEVLARAGDRIAGTDLRGGNRLIILHNGDEAYPAMLDAIDRAKREVFLCTYIFNYGEVARQFITALEAAHNRGVDTRVIVDGIGALYSWKKPWKILAEKGIKTTRFKPPRLFPPNFSINLRCHRKVLIADETGFTGGMNISDGDLIKSAGKPKNRIQDMQFQCQGPIVNDLRTAFLLNWAFCEDELLPFPHFEETVAGKSFCRILVDGPGDDQDIIEDLICEAISMARHTIRIMTPYFLPTPDLIANLRLASLRGVEVDVILPAKNNLAYMTWAMRRILPPLLQAGAHVWLQKPPFAHTKLLAVDNFYCQIGSANLDYRSMRLNFELNVEVFDADFHMEIHKFMDETIMRSQPLTLEDLRKQPLPVKLLYSASWIFSPYL